MEMVYKKKRFKFNRHQKALKKKSPNKQKTINKIYKLIWYIENLKPKEKKKMEILLCQLENEMKTINIQMMNK